ncbi:hypothetical protein KY328_03920 [Candidatus Woesearchaeota archaeon]|nr:hypothetical protein [Candidatus Woesearchaeota archaeon]MBW3022044.1 hypothetical protein [Candidatus Woesearchaeota archaeon]
MKWSYTFCRDDYWYTVNGFNSKNKAMDALEIIATTHYNGFPAKAILRSKKKVLYYTIIYKDRKPEFV